MVGPARIHRNDFKLQLLTLRSSLPSRPFSQYHASTITAATNNAANQCKMIPDGKPTADWSLGAIKQTLAR